MPRREKRKMTHRFFVFAVLVAFCLALALSGGAPKSHVQAVVCCSTCDETFQDCYMNCGEPPVGQGFYQYNQCISACALRHGQCQDTCDSGC